MTDRDRSADTVAVRYLVDDVAVAVEFYRDRLGFQIELDASPGFAALRHGALRLLVNAAGEAGGAAQPMPDGSVPAPGGWNRLQIEVTDLGTEVTRLRGEGATFRNEIVHGRGGDQILLQDPSGNLVELFQPR